MDSVQRTCGRGLRLFQKCPDTDRPVKGTSKVTPRSRLSYVDESSRPELVFHMPTLADDDSQKGSLFFSRLPLEIRRQIYNEVLPLNKTLWIRPKTSGDGADKSHFSNSPVYPPAPEYLDHFPTASKHTDTGYCVQLGGCCSIGGNSFWKCVALGKTNVHEDSMSLMRTCKRM